MIFPLFSRRAIREGSAHPLYRLEAETGKRDENKGKLHTYSIANLRGLMLRIGSSVKQTTNKATAARLRPPKMRMRSHRLTVDIVSNVSRMLLPRDSAML